MKKLLSLLAIALCFAAVLVAGWICKTPARPTQLPGVTSQSVPDPESKDLAKQLNGYADAITAFCVLQSIAFAISLGNADMRKHVLRTPFWLVPTLCSVALLLYVYVVRQCHIGEDSLLATTPADGQFLAWTATVRHFRFIAMGSAQTIALIGMFFTERGRYK